MKRLILVVLIGLALFISSACEGMKEVKPAPEKFEPFSFAIITDIHLGRNISLPEGNEYDRLERVVKEVNQIRNDNQIKFVVVLGDLSEHGIESQLWLVKALLDKLEVPYFPLIGNHDVLDKSAGVVVDINFQKIFNQQFFEKQFKKLGLKKGQWLFQENFTSPYLQNYRFSYGGLHFVCLDFVSREKVPGAGVWVWAASYPETVGWLTSSLGMSKNRTLIIFSHHPFLYGRDSFKQFDPNTIALTEMIRGEIEKNKQQVINFAGHTHDNDVVSANLNYFGIPVVITEALYEATNVIRIVKVNGKDISDIDYKTIVTIESISFPTPLPTKYLGKITYLTEDETPVTEDFSDIEVGYRRGAKYLLPYIKPPDYERIYEISIEKTKRIEFETLSYQEVQSWPFQFKSRKDVPIIKVEIEFLDGKSLSAFTFATWWIYWKKEGKIKEDYWDSDKKGTHFCRVKEVEFYRPILKD